MGVSALPGVIGVAGRRHVSARIALASRKPVLHVGASEREPATRPDRGTGQESTAATSATRVAKNLGVVSGLTGMTSPVLRTLIRTSREKREIARKPFYFLHRLDSVHAGRSETSAVTTRPT
jgi:hypothetical protein